MENKGCMNGRKGCQKCLAVISMSKPFAQKLLPTDFRSNIQATGMQHSQAKAFLRDEIGRCSRKTLYANWCKESRLALIDWGGGYLNCEGSNSPGDGPNLCLQS
eukprot:1160420-Pelagomonas_calceolata.AAC.6